MKSVTLQSIFFAVFLTSSVIGCTSAGLIQRPQPIHPVNSKQVIFSNITSHKVITGLKVSGNVKEKTSSSRRITISGHIHVLLKDAEGKLLETIKARTHRQYGNSKMWHFDGILKTTPLAGNIVVVKYHKRHR